MSSIEKLAARAAYMREYRQKNLEKVRAFERAQHYKHQARKLEYMKKYRAEKADKIAASKKRCYEAKKEEYLVKCRKRYYSNWERYRAVANEWREKNRERKLELDRSYYRTNKDKFLAYSREWAKKNPDKVKAAKARNRAKREAASGHCSAEQLRARIEFYGGRCAYCGAPFKHIDHVIPLARGGTHWPANLRPACVQCNTSKKAKKLHEWRNAA